MPSYYLTTSFCLLICNFLSKPAGAQLPDIRSVKPDLIVPEMTDDEPAAGRRVKLSLNSWQNSEAYHVLYLPRDWQPDKHYPVLVEWTGNGNYRSKIGDVSTGLPEDSKLGYGLSGGDGFIWLSLPYLNGAGDDVAITWWGDPPDYDPEPTLRYCREAVATVCQDYSGDKDRVVLCGFSRGAIAGNYLGLHDDKTSKLWCGFFFYSHYDGVRNWPYPNSDRTAALTRLQRLKGRPQFICHEGAGIDATRDYLVPLVRDGNLTFAKTGFRNHNNEWILRPSKARDAARKWLTDQTRRKKPSDRR
ncbi:hypothetical protein [Fuerstiella marisgermanici]|uniref:Uncharacterized protein n=1 Tax=Fuerstiella marisgermanici TaxID=1891926 RepID=A0A1P8WQB4_9PLAN|nr:hypothetical protein [Fuerstiella marisgermanici]APZ96245.1 hypothetical protein Fuma_05913 [Fuerstiella marisgermanici]